MRERGMWSDPSEIETKKKVLSRAVADAFSCRKFKTCMSDERCLGN